MSVLTNVAPVAAAVAVAGGWYIGGCIIKTRWWNMRKAKRKVIRQHGRAVLQRLDDAQIVALAKAPERTEGMSVAKLVTDEDIAANRWAPTNPQEVNAIATRVVLQASLDEMQANPEASGRVTFGDHITPPTIADGREVRYNFPKRKPLELGHEYWETLRRNREQIQTEMAARATQPAIEWVKPDHMTIHHGDYEDPLEIEDQSAKPALPRPVADIQTELEMLEQSLQQASPGNPLWDYGWRRVESLRHDLEQAKQTLIAEERMQIAAGQRLPCDHLPECPHPDKCGELGECSYEK